MRGTLSMASTVTFFAARLCMSSGFCAGQMNATSVWPSRMACTSPAVGARTLKMMSAFDQTAAASGARTAPAAA